MTIQVASRPTAVDAAVIGGGFYGLRMALHLRERMGMREVRVFERERAVMQRASLGNQARVHNGYHYPRSILTAYRSRVNFPIFEAEFRDAIVDDFDHYYAIARMHSKVNARQFEVFCSRVGAAWMPAPHAVERLFDHSRIERSYVVREPAFDAHVLRDVLLERIRRIGGITVATSDEVGSISAGPRDTVDIAAASGKYRAGRVVSSVYSGVNRLHRASGLEEIGLQQEISEMPLVRVPEVLERIGITIMDGPFFSLMPFPTEHLHTLSHVRFTPRQRWAEGPGAQSAEPNVEIPRTASRETFAAMRADAVRYVPAMAGLKHEASVVEVKTTLARSVTDDSRPILVRNDLGISNYTCVIGGKLDNIRDALDEMGVERGQSSIR